MMVPAGLTPATGRARRQATIGPAPWASNPWLHHGSTCARPASLRLSRETGALCSNRRAQHPAQELRPLPQALQRISPAPAEAGRAVPHSHRFCAVSPAGQTRNPPDRGEGGRPFPQRACKRQGLLLHLMPKDMALRRVCPGATAAPPHRWRSVMRFAPPRHGRRWRGVARTRRRNCSSATAPPRSASRHGIRCAGSGPSSTIRCPIRFGQQLIGQMDCNLLFRLFRALGSTTLSGSRLCSRRTVAGC